MEIAFPSITVFVPVEWFTVAQRIECSRARSKSSAPQRDNSGTQQLSTPQTPTIEHREQREGASEELALR